MTGLRALRLNGPFTSLGVLLGVVVGVTLRLMSTHIIFPPEHERELSARYDALRWELPLVLAVGMFLLVRPRRLGYSFGLGAMLGHALFYTWMNLGMAPVPLPAYEGPPSAAVTILWARPFDDGRGASPDLSTYDAAKAARSGPSWYRYVAGDAPSTGPTEVSVLPIDRNTWHAAVRSLGGACNVLIARNPPSGVTSTYHPWDTYGVLLDGGPCAAVRVTPETAPSDDESILRR